MNVDNNVKVFVLFILNLFDDTLSRSDCVGSDVRIINE
jgi:hypothetical protein